MSNLIVATSRVSDGNMYNRNDMADPETIKNKEAFLARHGITMEQTTRLHISPLKRDKELGETNWCRYREVTEEEKGAGMRSASSDEMIADAIITRTNGHALMLPIADCIGTVFYDPIQHVLMLSHLGRQSLEQQGAINSVKHLVKSYGSNPADIKVWMTPSASKEVYPIWALDNKGMKEVAFEQLAAAGIAPENITDNPAETDKDPEYYSYTNLYNGRTDVDGDHMIIAMMSD